MNLLKKAGILAVGVLSCIPALLVASVLLSFVLISEEEFLSDSPSTMTLFSNALMLKALPVMMAVLVPLTGYYLYKVFKSDWEDSKKTFWVLLLLIWFPFAAPPFWYLYLWKRSSRDI